MAEQLDVFLGGETSQFLTRLFDVIKSQEYIGTKIASEAPLDVLALPITIKKDSTPPLIAVSPKETSIKPEKVSPAASDISMKSVNKSKSQEPTSKLLLDAKGVLEPRKRRNSNRSRSRSRSNERLRRSRSRDRRPNEYGRDKNARQYRNSSPPTSGGRRLGNKIFIIKVMYNIYKLFPFQFMINTVKMRECLPSRMPTVKYPVGVTEVNPNPAAVQTLLIMLVEGLPQNMTMIRANCVNDAAISMKKVIVCVGKLVLGIME